jgi:hypothetical protein
MFATQPWQEERMSQKIITSPEVIGTQDIAPLDAAVTPAAGAEDRHERIANGAYLRAAARGFVGGDPMADWLAAEAEVDGSLCGPSDAVD